MTKQFLRPFIVCCLAWTCLGLASAHAAEYRSVNEVSILYDAPSAKSTRQYIAPAGMPVQVLVTLDAWVKVRDAKGDLAWIERRALSEKKMLVTLTRSSVRQTANETAAEVFQIDKGVLLELIEPLPTLNSATPAVAPARSANALPAGWARVRHAEGQMGFIKTTDVWGL